MKNVDCKTGLKKNIIDKEIFEKELLLCKQLSSDGDGRCGWGKCENCGVIPLLYKLHKGELLEDVELIKEIKKNIFK